MTGLLAPEHGASRAAVDADTTSEPPRAPRRSRRAPDAGTTGDTAPDGVAGAPFEPPPSRRRGRVRRIATAGGVLVALGAIATAGWWGPRALSRLAFFRVRRVEIDGLRYAAPGTLVARLGVDTSASVWTDLGALARRVAGDPMVADVRVERRLPGVLRVVVREREPVALAAVGGRGALVAYDAAGVALPVVPARVGGLDVPLVASPDPALLRVLGALKAGAPRTYARVLEAARAPRAVLGGAPGPGGSNGSGVPADPSRDELDFVLAAEPRAAGAAPARAATPNAPNTASASNAAAAPVLVRAAVGVAAGRFADLAPVEDDLARRGVRATELDLRFRDQVVARLPQVSP